MTRAMAAGLRWLAAIAFVLALTPVRAAESGLFQLNWTEEAPGIWVGNRADALRYPVESNSVIVLGPDGALVFDGGGFPKQGEQVLAKLKSLTGKPLLYVVISHWHGDHNRGIWPLLDAYPDAQVVGTTFTRDAMTGAPLQKITKSEKEGGAKDFADAVAAGLKNNQAPDGSPLLGDAERAYWERFITDNVEHRGEIDHMRITPPTLVFDDALDLDVGGRNVRLLHFGPGNTMGDAVMFVPDARFAAAGDLIVEPVPYGFNAYPAAWAEALRMLKALGATVIVPGHGAIQHDTVYVDLLIETLDGVAKQVTDLVVAGKSDKDIAAAVDFSAVETRFTKDDPLKTRFFSLFFKKPIVPAAIHVAKGIPNEKLTDDPEH